MKNHIANPLRTIALCLFLFWGGGSLAKNTFPQVLSSTLIIDTIKPVSVDSSEFILQGITRNGDTGENFDHIYLDVYKILESGDMELIRADRFPGGKFSIWLRKNERYILMMNYNNRAFLEGILNPADAIITDGILSQIFILDEYDPKEDSKKKLEEQENATVDRNVIASTPSNSISTTQPITNRATTEPSPPRYDQAIDKTKIEEKKTVEEELGHTSKTLPSSDTEVLGIFSITESTSFRKDATHLSDIILRFASGDEVELLEKTNQYWWKVRFKGRTGWVKAANLQ